MSSDPSTPPSVPTSETRPPALVSLERTAIFPQEKAAALLQAACYFKPEGITGYWTPTAKDLDGVEDSLEKFLEIQGRPKRGNWQNYRRQVAGLQKDAERFLFISYFVPEAVPEDKKPGAQNDPGNDPDRWKREAYWINDGGDTYFRVMYDLQKREFSWYERNSDP
jgi:hypothetical protein